MPPRRLRAIVVALGIAQIIGWGTTYYLPAILAPDFSAATGLSGRIVFGGITLMLFMAGLSAPTAGRLIGRDGARSWLTAGSCTIACGLLMLAFARGPVLFALGWIVIGLATPLALGQGASTAIVQATPAGQSRRPLTVILLFSGLASTAFWPVLISLDASLGLRGSLMVYAGLHLFVCAPLHFFVLPRRAARPSAPVFPAAMSGGPDDPGAQPPVSRTVFWLTALAFSLAGFISWGLPLHAIAILEAYGHTRATAVAIGSVLGPAQVLARLIDLAGGHRVDIMKIGVAAATGMPLAILVLLLFGTEPVAAILFAAGYGLSAGTMSLVRAVAPLRLFGRATYATMIGRLSQPQNIAFALAPSVLAAIRDAYGAAALLQTTLAAALLCLTTLICLARIAPKGSADT